MSRNAHGTGSPAVAGAPFCLPPTRSQPGLVGRRIQGPPRRLLTMVVVGFLLASPVITLLLAVP